MAVSRGRGRGRVLSTLLLIAVLAAQSAFYPAAAQQWSSPQRPPVEAPAKLFVRQSPNVLQGTRLSFEYQPGQGYVAGCLQRNAEYLFARGGGVALDLQASQSQETAIYGFRALFFGEHFTKAFVDTDGFVTFGDVGDSQGQDAAASARPRIAAFLTGDAPGLVAGPGSSVEAKLEGGSLVISYDGMRPFGSPQASLSFQIVLDEATGDVSITYGRMDFGDMMTWMTGLSPGSEVRSRTTEIFSQECDQTGRGQSSENVSLRDGLASPTPPSAGEDDDGGDTHRTHDEDAQTPRNSSSMKMGTGNDRDGEDITSTAVGITTTDKIAIYGIMAVTGGAFVLLLACCCCFCMFGQYCQCCRSRPRDGQEEAAMPSAAAGIVPAAGDNQQQTTASAQPASTNCFCMFGQYFQCCRSLPRDGQEEAAMPSAAAGIVPAAGDNQQQTTASSQPATHPAAPWLQQGQGHHQQAPPPLASAPPLPESERHRFYSPADVEGGRGAACADDGNLSISVITDSSDQSSFSLPPGAKGGKEVGDEDPTNQCVWCLDNPATHCFIPCGHRCVCQEHAELLCSSSTNSARNDSGGGDRGTPEVRRCCPICRQPIQGSLRIYV